MAWVGVIFLATALVLFTRVENWIDLALALALSILAGIFLVFAAVRAPQEPKTVDRAELGRLVAGGTVILGAASGYRAVMGPLEQGTVVVTTETGFPAAGLLLLATILRGSLAMFVAGSKRLKLSVGATGMTLLAWALFVFVLNFHISPMAFIGTLIVFLGTIFQDICSREGRSPRLGAHTPNETETEKTSPN